MKIKYFLYNAFLVENDGLKIAIDPGLNLWWFKLDSLISKSEWEELKSDVLTIPIGGRVIRNTMDECEQKSYVKLSYIIKSSLLRV